MSADCFVVTLPSGAPLFCGFPSSRTRARASRRRLTSTRGSRSTPLKLPLREQLHVHARPGGELSLAGRDECDRARAKHRAEHVGAPLLPRPDLPPVAGGAQAAADEL